MSIIWTRVRYCFKLSDWKMIRELMRWHWKEVIFCMHHILNEIMRFSILQWINLLIGLITRIFVLFFFYEKWLIDWFHSEIIKWRGKRYKYCIVPMGLTIYSHLSIYNQHYWKKSLYLWCCKHSQKGLSQGFKSLFFIFLIMLILNRQRKHMIRQAYCESCFFRFLMCLTVTNCIFNFLLKNFLFVLVNWTPNLIIIKKKKKMKLNWIELNPFQKNSQHPSWSTLSQHFFIALIQMKYGICFLLISDQAHTSFWCTSRTRTLTELWRCEDDRTSTSK